jgi:hypothetical protein
VAVSTARTAVIACPAKENRHRMNARRPTIASPRRAISIRDSPNGFSKCFHRKKAADRTPSGPPPSDADKSARTASSSAASYLRTTRSSTVTP